MITTSANKKANVRQITDADILSTSGQPVVATYEADSVAGQTMIPNTGSLPFLINTANRENFELFVDGRLFRYGADNDYTFADVDSNGFCSKIQLNTAIYGVVNIIAVKRGLKKEQELGVDQRFSDIYSAAGTAFQPFVDESSLLTATTSTSPSSSQFYSTVINRASIPNIKNDLKCRMGVERIMVQQIYQVQNEFGPNGEPVWGVVNDDRGLVRLVGGWSNLNNTWGTRVISSGTNNVDYIEITAYCTGLNLLTVSDSASKTISAYMDGNLLTSNFMPTGSPSGILGARNYSPNCVVNIASKQTLGLHTFRLLVTGSNPDIYGFEILNEASNINIRPGTAYSQLKPISVVAAQDTDYKSSFDAITKDGVSTLSLGGRGARVVAYLDTDGAVKKRATAVNTAQANLSSADHTNEELVRTYYWREFGVGRGDDFSLLATGAAVDRAFTLDDGTTSLSGKGVNITTDSGAPEGLTVDPNTSGNQLTFTFVGTGLDFYQTRPTTSTSTYDFLIDGTSIATGVSASSLGGQKIIKVVSGLPYGTHTFTIRRNTLASGSLSVNKFIVYGPKKPSIPSGAVELADYNVMADFILNNTAGLDTVATGILRKSSTREFIYSGSWSPAIDPTIYITGWQLNSSTSGGYAEYTFFGTGFDMRARCNLDTNSITVTLNGTNATAANFPTATFNAYGAMSFASPPTLSQAGSSAVGSGFRVSGLPLAKYTVRFTNNNSTQMDIGVIDIITPIHSPKSNLVADLQNTLPVGSCAISDNRQLKPLAVASSTLSTVLVADATGANTTTNTSSFVPLAGQSGTIKVTTGKFLRISFIGNVQNNTAGASITVAVYVNGTGVAQQSTTAFTANTGGPIAVNAKVPVSPGTHTVNIMWLAGSGIATFLGSGGALNTSRSQLIIEECN